MSGVRNRFFPVNQQRELFNDEEGRGKGWGKIKFSSVLVSTAYIAEDIFFLGLNKESEHHIVEKMFSPEVLGLLESKIIVLQH